MENLGVVAFTMATSALGIAIMGLVFLQGRLNSLESVLKEVDVIPKEYNSTPREFEWLEEYEKKGAQD